MNDCYEIHVKSLRSADASQNAACHVRRISMMIFYYDDGGGGADDDDG